MALPDPESRRWFVFFNDNFLFGSNVAKFCRGVCFEKDIDLSDMYGEKSISSFRRYSM